jgi:TctA family transporter
VRADQWADRARTLAVVAAAAVTFAGFLVARAFDIGPSLVLFSGLTGMPDLIKEYYEELGINRQQLSLVIDRSEVEFNKSLELLKII